MSSRKPHVSCFVVILILAALIAVTDGAFAAPLSIRGGKVVLSLSGLEIDLPPAPAGVTYKVSGSWSLHDASFDGRDVVDELKDDVLTAGNWVHVGYFDAGDCGQAVAEAKLDQSWKTDLSLWGAQWKVRGGIFTFDGALGRKPAVALCTKKDRTKSILLYRFFIDQPESMTRAAMLDALAKAAVPEAAWRSYREPRIAPVAPTKRSEVKNRGSISPNRREKLPSTGLDVQLPDDGFVWLVERRKEKDTTVDTLSRMAPALPDVWVEMARFDQPNCAAAFAMLQIEKRPVAARNLPAGWESGPQLVVGGDLELTACRHAARGVVIVGIFQGPRETDVAYLIPLLESIGRAALQPGAR
ncbi:MAG: hypothetical protein EG826_13610 [Deltaproteobacteria bacterium]|nr:hypothetical protein [Deltaproteobacteria bacterium]